MKTLRLLNCEPKILQQVLKITKQVQNIEVHDIYGQNNLSDYSDTIHKS